MDSSTGYSDELIQIKNNTFVRDGYEFICWNTKADGSGTDIQPNDQRYFQTDTTLYAKWKLLFIYMQLVKIGNVTVESNIAKQYSYNSGLRTPSFFNWNLQNSFTLVLKITTGHDINSKQIIWRMSNDKTCNLCLYNSRLLVECTGATSNVTFMSDTTYYLKIEKNGTTLTVSSATDGATYSQILTTSIHLVLDNLYFVFGYNYEYTDSRTVTYQDKIHHKDPLYKNEVHWYTKNGCAYADKNGRTYTYAQKLQHAIFKTTKKWIAKGNCKYYKTPSQWYLHENRNLCGSYEYVKTSEPDTSKSNNCGYWGTIQTLIGYNEYDTYETRTRQENYTVAVANFDGIMDFNESYFILNGIKNKLKA